MNIYLYYSYWDLFINRWQIDPQSLFNRDIYSQVHNQRANPNYQLQPQFLPEPFLGDIKNNSAVIINKNPGSPLQNLQHYQTGSFIVNHNVHLNYSNFAREFPYLNNHQNNNGGNWWNIRYNWINKMINNKGINSQKFPFALEVCPWHSNYLAANNLNLYHNDFIDYLNNMVIKPAEEANRHSQLGIILTIGNLFNQIFRILNFKKLIKIDQNNNNYSFYWPLNRHNNPANHSFSLYMSPSRNFYFNYSSGANFNTIPPQWSDNVERYLVNQTVINNLSSQIKAKILQ